MLDWIKNIVSGNVWLGVSKDEAVGSGVYRITFLESSIVGNIISKVISAGGMFSFSGYNVDVKEVDAAHYPGKVVLTIRTTKTATANAAGAGWYILLGGIGAAIIFSSIEKIEKLVDTTTTRTIQLGVVVLLILIVWKYQSKK